MDGIKIFGYSFLFLIFFVINSTVTIALMNLAAVAITAPMFFFVAVFTLCQAVIAAMIPFNALDGR